MGPDTPGRHWTQHKQIYGILRFVINDWIYIFCWKWGWLLGRSNKIPLTQGKTSDSLQQQQFCLSMSLAPFPLTPAHPPSLSLALSRSPSYPWPLKSMATDITFHLRMLLSLPTERDSAVPIYLRVRSHEGIAFSMQLGKLCRHIRQGWGGDLEVS